MKRSRICASALLLCCGGCSATTPTLATMPPAGGSVFGGRRPALQAEILGLGSAVPDRAEAGSSWVKRHILTEAGRAAAQIGAAGDDGRAFGDDARSRGIEPRGAAGRREPGGIRGGGELSPSGFDPNHLI